MRLGLIPAGWVCEAGWVAGFEELVSEALKAPFSGWDFSWWAARSRAGTLPWSHRREVARRAAAADAMLDMGTRGGERLSRLSPRPRLTVATEAWPPKVAAAARLRPLGIPVVQDEGAPEDTERSRPPGPRLRPRPVHPRAGAGVGARAHRLGAGRDRGGGEAPGRKRAQLRRRRRDAAAAGPRCGGCAHGRFRNLK
jgi:hypothetical protein